MPRKKTPEEYLKECKDKGLDLPVEDYVNNSTKIKHKCSKGHVYNQRPDKHLIGQGCRQCATIKTHNKQRKTPEEYYNECKSKGLDLPIEDYRGALIKVKHKCSKCGNIYEQKPNEHLRGRGCSKCSGNIKKTPEGYYNECKSKGYDLPSEPYVNNHTEIKHKCNKCGNIYEQTPNKHLEGRGCPKCGRKKMVNSRIGKTKKKITEEYIKECKEKCLDLPIESYINSKSKIKHKCSKCNNIYEQTPSDHLQRHGCPVCNESHGEKYIRNYLDKHSINYIPQKKFKDLKDKTYLSYDFYLPDYNILIEYQGIQHYKSFDYFGGKDKLEKQQEHDKLKREYAKENNYRLLELHYSLDTQDKVNKFLKRGIKS